MRTRAVWPMLFAAVACPFPVLASGHWYAAAAAPSTHAGQSELWGGQISFEAATPNKSRNSVFGEVGIHAGAHGASTLTQQSYLLGDRFAFRFLHKSGVVGEDYYALQPFAQVSMGLVRTKEGSSGVYHNGFGFSLGGGLEVHFSREGALRGQVDHMWFDGPQQDDDLWRISLGVVYRFERH